MTTAYELADLIAGALEGTATGVVAARWEGPADQLATPAVGVTPGDPWLETGRLQGCARARWTCALALGRWDAPASLALAQAAYLAALPLIIALEEFVAVEPLSAPFPESIGGVPTLVARFSVTLST